MRIKQLTRLEQVLIVVAVGVIGMYFFLNRVWDPMTRRMEATVDKHNELVAELNELRNKPLGSAAVEKEIKELRPEVESARNDLQSLKKELLVSGDDEERKYELLLNTLARNNGLTVREFVRLNQACTQYSTFADLQTDCNDLGRRAYTLIASGGYLDFIAFVQELGTLAKKVNLTGIDLQKAEYGRGLVTIKAVVLI